MVPRYRVGDRRMVVANRGLSGIDGTVSSAIGAALGRPHSSRAFALMGDLTFLHDQNGLVLGPDEPRPDLTIVVVNDDGGSIFALLEQGADEHAASFERLFGTPHGVRPGVGVRGDADAVHAGRGAAPSSRPRWRASRRGSRWSRPSYAATTGATSTPPSEGSSAR